MRIPVLSCSSFPGLSHFFLQFVVFFELLSFALSSYKEYPARSGKRGSLSDGRNHQQQAPDNWLLLVDTPPKGEFWVSVMKGKRDAFIIMKNSKSRQRANL